MTLGHSKTAGPRAPLVTADRLVEAIADTGVRIVDIRSAIDGGGRAAYETAHIPGAVHSDYTKDGWRAARGTASGLLPDPGDLAALFGRLGITPADDVVIVNAGTSAGDFSAAARVYWTLRTAGHHRVAILDGGMAAWTSDPARPLAAGVVTPRPVPPYPVAIDPTWRSDLAVVAAAVATGSAVLLDSRARSFFEGRDKSPQAKRAGRLPGAVLLDHTAAFAPPGRLKPKAELAALFADVLSGPVIHFCNTGHQAATNWFILSELLQCPHSTLYDGSMSEWTEDELRPVEAG
jgi:thiosulfate/3-mercaptopyruvate sulfurtransferase